MKKVPFKQPVADLAFLFKQSGISHIVICPGSRNAPLIQVFQRDPSFTCHSIVDERYAGYVALGMAKQAEGVVAVVTTSGTAALNLAPAVAEAYMQQIPLVMVTADRPPAWPPQFGNQRINQQQIFSPNAKGFFHFDADSEEKDIEASRIEGALSLIRMATTNRKGPVHLNVLLQEPLYETVAEVSAGLQRKDFSGNAGGSPEAGSGSSEIASGPPETEAESNKPEQEAGSGHPSGLSVADNELIRSCLLTGKKVLLIAGMQTYNPLEKEMLEVLVSHFQVSVIAENITNLTNELFISSPELLLAAAGEKGAQTLTPDLVVAFGGQVVSKRTRLFVQALEGVPVLVADHFPVRLFSNILVSVSAKNPAENSYLADWKNVEKGASKRAGEFFRTAAFSNITAIGQILEATPANTTVHLGNSGTIRYSQLKPAKRGLSYFANRGTSGIDGSLSTAAGAAMVSPGLHLVILGDLSFVYDSNALWNKNFPKNLRIIVLNDHGGGIFRLLEGPSKMPFFEEFSVTSHPVSLQHLAEAFSLTYLYAENYGQLKSNLEKLFSEVTGPALLEVNTSKSENSIIFTEFYKSVHIE